MHRLIRLSKALGSVHILATVIVLAIVVSASLLYFHHWSASSSGVISAPKPSVNADANVTMAFEYIRSNFGKFVVVDGSGVLYQAMLKPLSSHGINVHRLKSLDELKLIDCPKILIIDLLNNSIANELTSSTTLPNKLHECMMNGTYVLIAYNDTRLAGEVWRKLFGTSFPYASSEITATKVWSSGKKEYVAMKRLFGIVGMTYKIDNGRLIPVGVGGHAISDAANKNIEKLVSDALEGLVVSIMNAEKEFGGR